MLAIMQGEMVEQWPELCPGTAQIRPHRYVPGAVIIGWVPCQCRRLRQPAGHRSYWCTGCDVVVLVPSCVRVGNTTAAMGLTPPTHTG